MKYTRRHVHVYSGLDKDFETLTTIEKDDKSFKVLDFCRVHVKNLFFGIWAALPGGVLICCFDSKYGRSVQVHGSTLLEDKEN